MTRSHPRAWLLAAALVSSGCQLHALPETPLAFAAAQVRSASGPSNSATLLAAADKATLVCIGENHDDPTHHQLQLAMLEHLAQNGDTRPLALGLEMFQRRFQGALDDYQHGKLNDEQLVLASDWKTNWGFDYEMYQPLLRSALQHRIQLIGLNAHRSLTRAVSRDGLNALPAEVQQSLPELDLQDQAHRRFFWDVMGFAESGHGDDHGEGHGHGHASADKQERFYTAQVIWDETMAESAAAWLGEPARRIVVIAGNGHCHDSAIPARVRRRTPQATTLSIVVGSGEEPLPPSATFDFLVELPSADDAEASNP